MANVVVNDTYLKDIGKAIRSKNGKSTKYKPSQMANAISAISTGSSSYNTDFQIIQIPNTYEAISASSYADWISQANSKNVPTHYDLTAYGIKSDWSNFVCLIFTFEFYSYKNADNSGYGSGILYKENGKLKLQAHMDKTAKWLQDETASSNISFVPWNSTNYSNAAVWEIDIADFPANNVSFGSKYYRANVTTTDIGECVAFYSGELIRTV